MTTQLTVQELFQPAPSGVGPFGTQPLVPPSGTWLSVELEIATKVQLPTTSWQSGAPERTIFAVEAVAFSLSDANISLMAQGGFLQSAADGSVTYVTIDGTSVTTPVTPDPSNAAQNPTAAPGWLDLLTQNLYGTTRLAATPASGPLSIVNLGGSTVGPYSVGTYHVENTQTGATYKNPAILSIPTSQIAGTGGVVTAVAVGLVFTIITTQSAHGLTVGDTIYITMPLATGVTLANPFGLVTAATPTTFQISVSSSGTYGSGGTVYLCTTATMQADLVGIGSNAGPGTVTTAVTQNANVFVSNVTGWSGSNWESNDALAARAVLSLASRSPNGPAQAYVYFAETAQQLLADATPAYLLTNGAVTASEFANPQTGIVTTVVASATPNSALLGGAITPGCAQLPISAVTDANPAVITCTGPTSLAPGDSMTVTISGVLGVDTGVSVNGTFLGTYTAANSFSIPVDTTSAGAYTGGGSVEGGDLGQIDALIQQNVVGDNVTAVTVSALALPITYAATVVVPAAYVTAYRLAVNVQLAALIASYPVGGDSDSVPPFSVTWDDALEALGEAGVLSTGAASYVRGVQALTVNGVTGSGSGIAFPGNTYQAVLAGTSISVLGV